jgi:hypothetical protein
MSVVNGLTKQQVIQMMDDNDLERNEYTKISKRTTKKDGTYWVIGVDEFVGDGGDNYKYDVEAFRRVFSGFRVHLNVYREKQKFGSSSFVLTKYVMY